MPVNQKQMRDMMEADMKGKTTEQMMKEAQKKTESAPARQKVAEKKVDEPGLLRRTARRLKKVFGGESKQVQTKEMPKTNRTKQVESGLKKAGLTDKEMARFMPKGKK